MTDSYDEALAGIIHGKHAQKTGEPLVWLPIDKDGAPAGPPEVSFLPPADERLS